MNESETKLIKELFTEFKNEFPKLLLLILIFLILGMVGSGVLFCQILDVRDELKSAEQLMILFAVIFVICFLGIIGICIGCFITKLRQNKKQGTKQSTACEAADQNKNGSQKTLGKQELGQKLTAYIIEQGNYQGSLDRDQKFIDINRNVTKTYSVLGTALTTLSEKENMLREMAENGVKIRLCTMNPRMTVDDICIQEIKNQSCYFIEYSKRQMSDMDAESISQILETIKNGTQQCQNKHLLNLMHMLIEKEHMKEYYATSLDYETRIIQARHNLDTIQEKIIEKHGAKAMEIRDADSFIPISMTIADEKEEKGEMIVEFHLPFTYHKILFFVNRTENSQLFQTFMDFYEIVWRRAGNE